MCRLTRGERRSPSGSVRSSERAGYVPRDCRLSARLLPCVRTIRSLVQKRRAALGSCRAILTDSTTPFASNGLVGRTHVSPEAGKRLPRFLRAATREGWPDAPQRKHAKTCAVRQV